MFMIFPIIWRAATPWQGLRMQGNCLLETRQILGRGPVSQEVTAVIKRRARLGCWVMWHRESHTHFRSIYLSVWAQDTHRSYLNPRYPGLLLDHSLGLKSLSSETEMITLVLPLLLFFKIKCRDTCNVSEQWLAHANTSFVVTEHGKCYQEAMDLVCVGSICCRHHLQECISLEVVRIWCPILGPNCSPCKESDLIRIL